MKILVTGATGYIGGRLIPRLLELGNELTVLVRSPERIEGRRWFKDVTVVKGDLLNTEGLYLPTQYDVAYYLVHSMSDSDDFLNLEALAAQNFCKLLSKNTHVIYLGGLKPEGYTLSDHLNSRIQVGQILSSHFSVTEFRAGPVIGSGSASFEMVRNLTERLPVMIAPKWVKNSIRPIAIRDILSYLIEGAKVRYNGCLDVGCPEPVQFIDMMLGWAEIRGFKRIIIPVPVLAPGLAARWVGLVTPITNRLAVPIIKGMQNSIIGDTEESRIVFPTIKPISYKKAIELANQRIEANFIETMWSGALGKSKPYILEEREGIIHETRTKSSHASSMKVFQVVCSAGGQNGWFAWNWAWRLRGFIDRIIGGPGIRRGRRDPSSLIIGEAVDFWRVEEVVENRCLRLRAEMKVPGKAWLEWDIKESPAGSTLTQTAFFNPNGVLGRMYWILLYPIHCLIFSGMIKEIIRRSEVSNQV